MNSTLNSNEILLIDATVKSHSLSIINFLIFHLTFFTCAGDIKRSTAKTINIYYLVSGNGASFWPCNSRSGFHRFIRPPSRFGSAVIQIYIS